MRASVLLPPSVAVIEGFLEGLVCANLVLIRSGVVPASPLDANVHYQREASGLEEWNIASVVVRLGWGDCEDLNGWEAAGLRFTGEDPGARAVLYRTGEHLYHCVVERSDGRIHDVCPALGMHAPRGHALPGRKRSR